MTPAGQGGSHVKRAAPAFKPSPDFTCDLSDGCRYDAGLRPWRKGTYRLEAVNAHGKLLVHNYGHGGAGITMSWGCASKVREIVTQTHSPGPAHRVAVLGAGVMGLTAAALLREAQFEVKIYAEKLFRTTSDVAGGQWSPSIVDYDRAKEADFFKLLKKAHAMHKARLGTVYGVSERVNYCLAKPVGLEKAVKAGAIPAPQTLNLPFQHLNKPGFAYNTMLVEPPIFLERLRYELRQQNVPFVQKSFTSEQEMRELAESIVINCTGLGSRKLFNDPNMKSKKGQLVLLKPQPTLDYLYSTASTYVFPRADCVVVGGTEEDDDYDCQPVPARCRQILQAAVLVFSGMPVHPALPELWMIRSK